MMISYKTQDLKGLKIFYREAGSADKPTMLLFHGFPSASHMFRDLIPELEEHFYLIAPDYPSFGQSDSPSREDFTYTFDHLVQVMDDFLQALNIKHYCSFVFDYGATHWLSSGHETPRANPWHHQSKWQYLPRGFGS